jgi:hypothetical protein
LHGRNAVVRSTGRNGVAVPVANKARAYEKRRNR